MAGLEAARQAEADAVRVNAMAGMDYSQARALLAGEPERAGPFIEAAARRGLPAAQLRLGRMRLQTGHATEALMWFRRAADSGDGEAMNMVGRALELGWGCIADEEAAAVWYRRSAETGCAWGRYNLAHMLFDGRGVARDLPGAFALYRAAAEEGHARAMSLVGRCLEEAWGCDRDRPAAAAWYERSAKAGYFRGAINHALVLAEAGRWDEAESWLAKARELENGLEEARLGVV